MKTFVLMHKVTAQLFEGVRVSFFDKNDTQYVINGRTSVGLQTLDVDGFLLSRPDLSELFWYVINQGIENDFEVLGEL